MQSDVEAVKKSVRTYMMIGGALLAFTGITVAANLLQLSVPAAITLALIIATIKASMVAAVFMHLSHEKRWIYGSLLLTVAFFVVLIFVPLFTTMNTFGTHVTVPGHEAGSPPDEHAGH
jgi:cytochrome c oxidase subunit 4